MRTTYAQERMEFMAFGCIICVDIMGIPGWSIAPCTSSMFGIKIIAQLRFGVVMFSFVLLSRAFRA